MVRVVDEGRVGLRGDALLEGVVVVGGQTDHREDLAGLGVHHDDHPLLEPRRLQPPLQRGLRLLLHLQVDRELQRVARLRLLQRGQHLDGAAGGVALHLLDAVGPAQLRLVLRLEPRLADQVVRQVPLGLECLELRCVDRRGVAEHLRQQRAVRVLAPRVDHDLDPGQLEMILRDQLRRGLGHVRRDLDAVEDRARVGVDGLVDLRGRQMEELREAADDVRPLRKGQVGGNDLDRERGHVLDQWSPGPVDDDPARRLDRLERGHVRVGLRAVLGALGDLEIGQADRERTRG